MEDNRPPIEGIIRAWKSELGETRTSERGLSYIVIRATTENLKALARTMLDSGYVFDDIDSISVALKIANICWREDKIVKMTNSEIKKAKAALTDDWNEAIAEFSGIVISEYKPLENPVYVSIKNNISVSINRTEKVLDIEPKDRIKMDTSDMVEAEVDLDFLSEFEAEEWSVKKR